MPEPDDIAQLSLAAWIDQVADRFDAAWQAAGDPPALADFASDAAGDSRLPLLKELVAIDQEYRERRGLSKAWDAYVVEFPELADLPATDSVVSQSTVPLRKAPVGEAARQPNKQAAVSPHKHAEQETEPLPATIGKYQVLKRLGGGGQATAYLAFDPDLSKSVVLKLSHDPPEPGELDALRQEGRVLAELEHPALVRVLHYDTFDGRPFVVMEHVAGQNLSQWAAGARPGPVAAARIVERIARAIALAHKQGIVHRDLKPANVLIDADGAARVIDFGLAWHRHGYDDAEQMDSSIAGTVAYMAPEQARARNDQIGPRSDIFGLGSILYFLLTEQAPFMEPGERNFQRVLKRARSCSFDANLLKQKQVPPSLERIVLKAMAADPADRYATADELADDLATFADAGRLRRRALLATAVGIGALAAIGAAVAARSAFGPGGRAAPQLEDGMLTLKRFKHGSLQPGSIPSALTSGVDQVQLRWQLPAGYVGDLYAVTPDNRLQPLRSVVPTENGEYVAPAPEQGFPIEGAPGTELFLLGVRREHAALPTIAWDPSAAWPALPAGNVWRLLPPERIIEIEKTKVGLPVGVIDPTEAIRSRVLALAKSLEDKYDHFEALIVPRVRAAPEEE